MTFREGQYRPDRALIQSRESFEADTLSVVLHGNKEQVSQLSPAELILMFDHLEPWIGVADVSDMRNGQDAKKELLRAVRDIAIELGDAVYETDQKKVERKIQEFVKRLRRYTPLFELAKAGETTHTELERTEKNKDLALDTYFDPTMYAYDTIAADSERILLSFDQILAKYEHAEDYEPVLESLATAMSQIMQQEVVKRNNLLYKDGTVSLADIKVRMPERHWHELTSYLQTYRELHHAIKGKEFADNEPAPGQIVDSRGRAIRSTDQKPDVPFANLLHIAVSETVASLEAAKDEERTAAREMLDTWYGPNRPDQFDVEALVWDIELQAIVAELERAGASPEFIEAFELLTERKKITKRNVEQVLSAIEHVLLFTQSDEASSAEYLRRRTKINYINRTSSIVIEDMDPTILKYDKTPNQEFIKAIYPLLAKRVVAIARYQADLADQITEAQEKASVDSTKNTISWKERFEQVKRFLAEPLTFNSAEIVLQMREQEKQNALEEEKTMQARDERLGTVIDTLKDTDTVKEILKPVVWYGDLDLRREKKVDLRLLREVTGSITYEESAPLEIPQLRECGSIIARATTACNLPRLQTVKNLSIDGAITLDVSELRICEDIYGDGLTELDIPNLQKSRNIYAGSITKFEALKLLNCRDVYLDSSTTLSAPNLQRSGSIRAHSVTILKLPELQICPNIIAESVVSLQLNSLQYGRVFVTQGVFDPEQSVISEHIKIVYRDAA